MAKQTLLSLISGKRKRNNRENSPEQEQQQGWYALLSQEKSKDSMIISCDKNDDMCFNIIDKDQATLSIKAANFWMTPAGPSTHKKLCVVGPLTIDLRTGTVYKGLDKSAEQSTKLTARFVPCHILGGNTKASFLNNVEPTTDLIRELIYRKKRRGDFNCHLWPNCDSDNSIMLCDKPPIDATKPPNRVISISTATDDDYYRKLSLLCQECHGFDLDIDCRHPQAKTINDGQCMCQAINDGLDCPSLKIDIVFMSN